MNTVIIGCGAVGPVHMEVAEGLGNASLYGVCDIIRERSDKYASKYNCKAYYDFADVINDVNVDCVHICTPHYLHYQMVTDAATAGKHVVVEKPAAITRDEFEKLLTLEKECSSKICAVVQNRENVCVKKLLEIAESKADGEIRGIFASLRWYRDEAYYKSEPWRGKWKTEGGGLMINQAVHLLDMMCLFGGKAASVKAAIHNRGIKDIEVEDTADATILFENGSTGIFSATNLYPVNIPPLLEINFENCTYRYSDGLLSKITDGNIEIITNDAKGYIGKKYWGISHGAALENFYNALEQGNENYVHLHDVKNTMDVLFNFYEGRELQ